MPNEITLAAARSAKAAKTLDTMRARITKADEAWDALATQAATHAGRLSPRRRAGRPHAAPVGALGEPSGRGTYPCIW